MSGMPYLLLTSVQQHAENSLTRTCGFDKFTARNECEEQSNPSTKHMVTIVNYFYGPLAITLNIINITDKTDLCIIESYFRAV